MASNLPKRRRKNPPAWDSKCEAAKGAWGLLMKYDSDVEWGAKRPLDRYNCIQPFEFNMWASPPEVPYYNGSIIDLGNGANAIASQAPLPAGVADFIFMVVKHRVRTIVTLGNISDCGASGFVKMECYWNNDESSALPYRAGKGGTVLCSDVCDHGWAIQRTLMFHDDRLEESQTVQHLHFHAWPDHGVPLPDVFERAVSWVLGRLEEGLTLVHCSAGVGRTGTLLAALRLKRFGSKGGLRDVFECVGWLKSQRVLMVESPTQFRFLVDHFRG